MVATAPTQAHGVGGDQLDWGLTLEGAREVELSYASGCEARLVSAGAEDWLAELRTSLEVVLPSGEEPGRALQGKNMFVNVSRPDMEAAAAILVDAFEKDPSTRAMVLCRPEEEHARGSRPLGRRRGAEGVPRDGAAWAARGP